MSRISSLMSVGRRSMMNAQTGLHTVSHNIANKETEGYSRQRTESYSNFPLGTGKTRVGMGARAAVVRRINNPYLERQIGTESSELAKGKGRQNGLMRLEQAFDEQTVDGFSRSLTRFFNSFRELSTEPESMPRRTQVKESAQTLVRDFRAMDQKLRGISGDIDSQIKLTANEVNTLTQEIAELNHQVQKVEINGGWANDERDRRDLLIKKLGELINIKWAEGEDSSVTVSTANDALLVVGTEANRIEAVSTPARGGKIEAAFDIVYYHHDYADPLLLTDRIEGGQLGGLLSVRKGELSAMQKDMDNLAFTLANEVNRYHKEGYNSYNQTGVLFFAPLGGAGEAASRLSMNSEILADVGRIVAGNDPDRPGDNRIANAISQVQYQKTLFDGTMSVDDFYNGLVGEVAIKAQHANNQVGVQENVVKQLSQMRESLSGVSLDEEAANMIEMQKQFDASARVIRTADEILETVINLV